jgi:hypothetical protein
VTDAQLGRADTVAGGDVGDLGVVDDQPVRERRVRLDQDVVLGARRDRVGRVVPDEPADLPKSILGIGFPLPRV